MFIFKPENIDPVTMPFTVTLSYRRVDVCLILGLRDVGAGQVLASCPAHPCVPSQGSLALASAGVALAPEGFV